MEDYHAHTVPFSADIPLQAWEVEAIPHHKPLVILVSWNTMCEARFTHAIFDAIPQKRALPILHEYAFAKHGVDRKLSQIQLRQCTFRVYANLAVFCRSVTRRRKLHVWTDPQA